MLLGGELPDDPGDLGPLVLGALLGEPGAQVGDRQGKVLDGSLKVFKTDVYSLFLHKQEGNVLQEPAAAMHLMFIWGGSKFSLIMVI